MREADLYPDLKAYLEAQGYVVKAEIGACDLMARRGVEPPVIVEMKLSFSLALVMQGVARQALFDDVYLAVPVAEKGWTLRYKDIIALCRRLGLGLLAVRPGQVEAHHCTVGEGGWRIVSRSESITRTPIWRGSSTTPIT